MATSNFTYVLVGVAVGAAAVWFVKRQGATRPKSKGAMSAKARRAHQRERMDRGLARILLSSRLPSDPESVRIRRTKAYKQGVRSAHRKLTRIGRAPKLRAEAR